MKVSELQKLDFSCLSLNEKLKLKNNGRPTPILTIVQVQKKCKSKDAFMRKLDKYIYDKTSWICGCEERNSLFCFVCLLFGGNDSWTKDGVNDLKHLSMKKKTHENSARHRENLVSFQFLGKTNISKHSSKAYTDEVQKHNETVTKNRHVLSKIIEILKLCGNCRFLNNGVLLELSDCVANIDSVVINSQLEEAKVFAGTTSKDIQNEILDCMFEVYREYILDEIKKSSFLAVMVEDTTDVSTETQAVLVLRYELNGKIFEHFWGFINPATQDVNGLTQCMLEHLYPILKDCPDKLIAQMYDGSAVKSVNVKVKELYKNAHFIYSHTHQLEKILEQAVWSIPSVQIFFANLNGISTFFSQSQDAMNALWQRISRDLQAEWNCHSRIAQSVYNNKDDIIECCENITLGIPKNYNIGTMTQAAGFLKWLEDDTFLFWLIFFSKLMPHVEVVISELKINETDEVKIQIALDSFQEEMTKIRSILPTISNGIDAGAPKKRRRQHEDLNLSVTKVCDIIISEVRNWFSFKSHLSGVKLFLKEKYEEYRKTLPLKDVETFCNAYPMINKENLKMELGVFYSRKEITEHADVAGCLQTLNFILSYGLDTAFKEIVQVLKILVTIPMTTCETERQCSILKLIKSFLKSTGGEEKLTALTMLSVEKSMVPKILDFNEKVIEKFIADKNRRIDFHLKK